MTKERLVPSFSGSVDSYYNQILRMAESEARIPVRSIDAVKAARKRQVRPTSRPQQETPHHDMLVEQVKED